MNNPPASKWFGGTKFTEGEVFPMKGVGFIIVCFTKRGIALRPEAIGIKPQSRAPLKPPQAAGQQGEPV